MTRDLWLEAHSYLRPIADLSAEVDRAAAGIEVFDARLPDWDDYRLDFLAGVPLLSSADADVDLEPGGRMAAALVERLASGASPEWLAAEARALDADLRGAPDVSRRIADFLRGDETVTPPFPGLLRYLGWTAMARYLRPVVNVFDGWRDEDRWLRRVLPDVRIPAGDGAAGRRRPRPQAPALVRLLRHALAVQANRLPVL